MRTNCLSLRRAFLLLTVWPLAGQQLQAAEAYVLQFRAHSPLNSCEFIDWHSEVIFHNSKSEDARVRLLGLSNGASPGPTTEVVVPTGRTVSAGGYVLGISSTGLLPQLWVARIDVPEGVMVQSRAEAWLGNCTLWPIPLEPAPSMGVFSLPVVRALDPPNVRKIHLGADLGGEHSYVNVGVYNASSRSANATIELRHACDDAAVAERDVTIPANSVVQVGGLDGPPATGCYFRGWIRYVAVTVDQPSFSYIVNKMYDLPQRPRIAYGSP